MAVTVASAQFRFACCRFPPIPANFSKEALGRAKKIFSFASWVTKNIGAGGRIFFLLQHFFLFSKYVISGNKGLKLATLDQSLSPVPQLPLREPLNQASQCL